jgi:hypothetical protein
MNIILNIRKKKVWRVCLDKSIFENPSLNRIHLRWEEHIFDLSPVEKIGNIWIKREDKFAPLGYGNINGSKLRVCIWLISNALQSGAKGVIHGAVTGSPQHPMVATICKHYGAPCVDVVGTDDIAGHPNLVIAQSMGASFVPCKVGYAKTLEATAYRLQREKYKDYFVLETNITVNEGRNSVDRIRSFHTVGGTQAANIPDNIETIILPAGSCNSAVGALYGLAYRLTRTRTALPNLKRIILLGIGNYGSKDPDFIRRRLDLIGAPDIFNWPWNVESGLPFNEEPENKIAIHHYDLNGSGYCSYSDLMPYTYGGVVTHPRYEGKCFHYMEDNEKIFGQYFNDKTMFWIVGGPVEG